MAKSIQTRGGKKIQVWVLSLQRMSNETKGSIITAFFSCNKVYDLEISKLKVRKKSSLEFIFYLQLRCK